MPSDRIDLAALADALDTASSEISTASTRMLGPNITPVPSRVVEALCSLWRLEGELRGMASALRMVESSDHG
jgi:hypothetical protein